MDLAYIILSITSILRYDPTTDKWSPVVAMNCRRSGAGVCVVNGKLYVIGGFDGSTYLKSVEWMDTESGQWRVAANMHYRRLGCGAGVLKMTNPL